MKTVLAVALLGVTPAGAQISRTTFGGLYEFGDFGDRLGLPPR